MSILIDQIDDDDDLPGQHPAANPSARAAKGSSVLHAKRRRIFVALKWAAIVVMALLIAGYLSRGKGYFQWVSLQLGLSSKLAPPLVVAVKPTDGSVNVNADEPIVIRLLLPNGGIDPATLTSSSVQLRRPDVDATVPATLSMAVAADGVNTIVLTPSHPLDGGAKYSVIVTKDVKDLKGIPIVEKSSSFTTGSLADPSIKFEQVQLPTATGFNAGFTCVQAGPDGNIWAGTDDGRIFKFPIESNGVLGKPQIYSSLQQANGGPRLLTGFCFDPASTPEAPIVWVDHGWYAFDNAIDLSGKMSRVRGAALEIVEDVIVGLPRSKRDHLTNQPVFGPDGAIYFPQPSNSAFGAPDEDWGNRPEHLLNASILRVDPKLVTPGKPIDVRTPDVGGTYNPAAPGAPLTIYATGVRLAYDLCWHTNGNLYAPVNGSSAGGNTPATPAGFAGPAVPGLNKLPDPEHDWFFRVQKGKYYGHPNPVAGHYVLNGGNPTAGDDPAQVPQYPVGTKPDPLWSVAAYDFGNHVSPNGVIEYKSDAFGGKLKGKVLVCRYNGGSDILCLDLDEKGDVHTAFMGIPGFTKLNNPLDLTEDPKTGCIYISEYGAQKITLLRPVK